jgi:hypothetical protein
VDCHDVDIIDNTIEDNTGAQIGGGVYINNSTNISFEGGVIENNTSTFQGGGVAALGSSVDFLDVEFLSNYSPLGGGIAAPETSTVSVSGCRFLRNSASVGGGLYASPGSADVTYNLFVGNEVTGAAGALFVGNLTSGLVAGNTLDRNLSSSGTGGLSVAGSDIEIFNNIVTNSTGHGLSCSGIPLPTPSYNLVWNSSGSDYDGCTPGTGSLSGDPLYVDTTLTDYHLGVHSPAIDAGRPGVTYEDPDGSRGDMGWYGSHSLTMDQPSYPKNLVADVVSGDVILSWDKNPESDVDKYAVYSGTTSDFKPSAANFVAFVTAPDTSLDLGTIPDSTYHTVSAVDTDSYAGGYAATVLSDPATGTSGGVVRYNNRLYQNVPNPFNPSTKIRYELRGRADVSLVIYDVAGRQVKRLVSAKETRGVHAVDWNGFNDQGQRVSSGIYFYRLQAGAFVQTRKMILLK